MFSCVRSVLAALKDVANESLGFAFHDILSGRPQLGRMLSHWQRLGFAVGCLFGGFGLSAVDPNARPSTRKGNVVAQMLVEQIVRRE